MTDSCLVLPELPCIRYVDSFEELVSAKFSGEVNALCWPRKLEGDFAEIVEKLQVGPGITTVDLEMLASLELSPAGEIARKVLLEDQAVLEASGLFPILDCINGYVNLHEDDSPMSTDVQSYHVDTATDEADTFLCTYFGTSSEALPNDQVFPKTDDPEIRAELLALYGGEDDGGFVEFLNENFYDLHYMPVPGARPWSFGVGNLWRIACDYPGSPVLPCVHRAPDTVPDAPPRLLLIS